MDAVPTADFVVTNPTHVACALKYVAEEMDSPMLIAKGTELIAKKIIDIAKEHNVPIIEKDSIAFIMKFIKANDVKEILEKKSFNMLINY